ncbi:hypothetical protein L202_00587 [Cryptococcus amylolentus CBS 6039]|uniref:F-box domain-containing protein n=1 Tax=Cryptococcus amylolentus CBS 6039 TaxID=1295533 RepID=A0A1E3I8L4_9TREE|nr:hypothetical protein L202_00587 [Cryptococcus amylolentus CBS 6039]ODN84695.1 hypothetical protein L202_00587 [Cryptococcus amylolentus CBS 6039]
MYIPKHIRMKKALKSTWPDYAITGRKPELPLPAFPITSLLALQPVHTAILDALLFLSSRTYMLLSKEHYARAIPLSWRHVVLNEELIDAFAREEGRKRNNLQYTVSIRIAKVSQIAALESVPSHSSKRRIFERVRQVELTTTAFKALWDKGEQDQLDLGSIEECLGDDLEELLLWINRVPKKTFALPQKAFDQLLGILPTVVTFVLAIPNSHAPSWPDMLERFPALLRHWYPSQCLRIVFKIPSQMVSLVRDELENAIITHIAFRARDKAVGSAGVSGCRVEYHLDGVDRLRAKMRAIFEMSDSTSIGMIEDFVEEQCELVELVPLAFPFRRSGME